MTVREEVWRLFKDRVPNWNGDANVRIGLTSLELMELVFELEAAFPTVDFGDAIWSGIETVNELIAYIEAAEKPLKVEANDN